MISHRLTTKDRTVQATLWGKRSVGTATLLVSLLAAVWSAAQEAPQSPSEADQSTAVGCLRSINTAEAYYSKEYKKGFSPTLLALGPPPEGAKPSATAAGLLDKSLTSGKRNSYVFTYQPGPVDAQGNITSYTVTARPVKWAEGVPSFLTDQTGAIHQTEEERAPTSQDPAIGD